MISELLFFSHLETLKNQNKKDFERVSIFWGLFRRPEKVLNKVKLLHAVSEVFQ